MMTRPIMIACVLLVSLPALAVNDITAFEPDEHTILLYHFDGEGDTITDSSGNGFHGTLNEGTAERVPGVLGSALKLAPRQSVRVNAPLDRIAGMEQLTVEFWFRARADRAGSRQRMVLFWEHFLLTLWEDGSVYGHIYDAGGGMRRTVSRTSIVPGTWYRAAMTYDGAQVKLLINGQVEATAKMTGPVNAAPGSLLLSTEADDYFSGEIDELRISSVARTDFIQPRIMRLCAPVVTTAVSPGSFRIDVDPVVPAAATDVAFTIDIGGVQPIKQQVAAEELSRIATTEWATLNRQTVLPVPAGLPAGEPTLTCTLTYRVDGEMRTRTQEFPVHIDPLVSAPAQEFRAAWTHFTNIRDPETLFERFAAAGLNVAIMHCRRGETAFFDSKVGPLVQKHPDSPASIAMVIEAAHRHGIQIHPYVNCFTIGQPKSEFAQQAKAEGRWARTWDGNDVEWWCPSHPGNVEIIKNGMLEVVRDYPVDGIQYDFIRYDGPNTCYCDRCRARFEERIGKRVENWPADVRAGGSLESEYLEQRASYVTEAVRDITTAIRAIKPDILISAAVQSQDPQKRKLEGGQDWLRWAREGLVDALCPMNYTADPRAHESISAMVMEHVNGLVPVYMGVGVASSRDVMRYPEQLAVKLNGIRRHHCDGFALFAISDASIVPEQVMLPIRETMLPGDGKGE